ncbi:MAG: HAD-IIIA family hydrolase [Crenarchaeota archaeon]|nr:MAG: HAD-IIIA family hydrolase [Thermoproteota archaeon]
MAKVIMICGAPASGKTTVAQDYINQGYIHLNRHENGKLVDLLSKFKHAMDVGANVVVENNFPTAESRRPYIELCDDIKCIHVDTSIEESQINALHRMWKSHKQIFFTAELTREANDINIFPVAALFRYRKNHNPPSLSEGFTSVEKVKFQRQSLNYENKALILDYDDTLRYNTGEFGYPCNPSEVRILPNRVKKIKQYQDAGYILLGVSNQSGIHKGNLRIEDAKACFERTNELLGANIDFYFCPHKSNPPNCYCRKPQSALGVLLIEKYKLNSQECIFVGDQTSDATFAKRLGFNFYHADRFFKA